MLLKHAGKLANSLKKRKREWDIYRISRGLLDPRKVNTVRSVEPNRRVDKVETAIPYDEKYFEPRYGDMRQRAERRVVYDVYEYYAVVEALAGYLGRTPQSLKVLDIGCNNGYVVSLLRQTGFEAYGIDVSDYAFQLASPFVRPFLYKGGFDDIPFADNTFDVAVSWGTIEHLPEDRSDACLTEAIRVSRSAVWIGCDNVPQSIEPYHLTNYPIDWWERKLERLGQRVDPNLREAVRRHPFLWKRRFYWDALECVLKK